MILSKLYSNQPDEFETINFKAGLNVVLARISSDSEQDTDPHNAGKSTLGKIIDFCLLKRNEKSFFLFEHPDVFNKYIFFLELDLENGQWVTIRRSVNNSTLISFSLSSKPKQDLNSLPLQEWQTNQVTFERAKEYLDGLLNIQWLSPWDYRDIVGYLIRGQNDFQDVFRLEKNKWKHGIWKPLIAHWLGLDGQKIAQAYEHFDEKITAQSTVKVRETDITTSKTKFKNIEGVKAELQQTKTNLNQLKLNFKNLELDKLEKRNIKETVEYINKDLTKLNREIYGLSENRRIIKQSLEGTTVKFDLEETKNLYSEAQLIFVDQLKNDFETLIEFNKSITKTRSKFLRLELKEIESNILKLEDERKNLMLDRASKLNFLGKSSVFEKVKLIASQMESASQEVQRLESISLNFKRFQEAEKQLEKKETQLKKSKKLVAQEISSHSKNEESKYNLLATTFNDLMTRLTSRSAKLEIGTNREGNFEVDTIFWATNKIKSSEGEGFSYKKLLCVAFDLAIAANHVGPNYINFLFLDGVMEALYDSKRSLLIEILRETSTTGMQLIITTNDSDLPNEFEFSDKEIVLRLNETEEGRLFKIPIW